MNEIDERLHFTRGIKRFMYFVPILIILVLTYEVLFNGISKRR